jgi:CheY-like chemotaxis protein
VDRVTHEDFDAVLMDVQMPVMDGYAATEEIRKWEGGRRKGGVPPLPIIAMTANAMSGDSVKSIAAGMNAHITKPIDPGLLFETLARWVPSGERRPRASAMNASSAGRRRAGMPDEPFLPEDLPGFDLAEGLRRLQGNETLYRRLILNFADQHRHEIDALRRALENRDWDHVRHRVHAIKGVAGNLAAKPLQAAAAGFEGLISAADPKGALDAKSLTNAFEVLDAALQTTVNAADALRPAGDDQTRYGLEGAAPARPPEIGTDLTAALRAAAELGDGSELVELAQGLSESAGEFSAIGDRIRRMAEDFDFEGILKLVAEFDAMR